MTGALSLAILSFGFVSLVDSFNPVDFFTGQTNFSRSRRQAKSCFLPEHPLNGRWAVLNGVGSPGPGGTIPVNSVIKFDCDKGYKISAITNYVICDDNWDSSKMPECVKLCPPIYATPSTTPTCYDKKGAEIQCHEATDGTRLKYECKPFYEIPFGLKNNLFCIDGSWNYPKSSCEPVCGKKINDDALTLIHGGTVKKELTYPWIVAVYQKINDQYTNVCGGSLISRRVALTAAHCVTNEYGDLLKKENYRVGVGKFYGKYGDARDAEAQYSELVRIAVPEDYKGASRNFLGDMAVLITQNLFILSQVVQPICFNNVNNIYLYAGLKGEISGWGTKEDGKPSDVLRTLEIPYKYETTCAEELPKDWADKYNMRDKICAGFFNQSMSVCPGDSGSGLAFKDTNVNRYYIHGLVSLGPSMNGKCNVQQNALYTKIAHYYEFIDRELSKYSTEECLLPEHPQNGKWTLADAGKKPGDTVPPNTVLIVVCNSGYALSSGAEIKCDGIFTVPKCLATTVVVPTSSRPPVVVTEKSKPDNALTTLVCPNLKFPSGTSIICKNKDDVKIDCSLAVEGSTISFTCPEGYQRPAKSKGTSKCSSGSWTRPKPRCKALNEPASTEDDGNYIDYSKTKVICSYASWQSYKEVWPEDFNASLCSHMVYTYAGLLADGNVRVQDDPLDLDGAQIGLYRRLTNLKDKNKDLKVLLSVGGSGASNSSLFSNMASDPSKRAPFIASLSHWLKTYNFDGVDIEWLAPTYDEKDIYVTLLEELREEFQKHNWLVTATVKSWPENLGYDASTMNRVLDYISIKSYDFYGSWSKYTGQNSALYPSPTENEWEKKYLNLEGCLNKWLEFGIDKSKLVLSIAFYGRSFILKDRNKNGVHSEIIGAGPGDTGGLLRYSELCKRFADWTRVWDDDQKNPYKYQKHKWFGYDDKDSVWIKAAYIKEKGLYGVNVWTLDGDDVHGKCGTKQILLKHVHGGLGNAVDFQT